MIEKHENQTEEKDSIEKQNEGENNKSKKEIRRRLSQDSVESN